MFEKLPGGSGKSDELSVEFRGFSAHGGTRCFDVSESSPAWEWLES
jgi:hypothetical protein